MAPTRLDSGQGEIRWGMVGCGSVALTKSAPSYQRADGSKLAAVSSRRAAAAREYARLHGVDLVFDDPVEMIRSPHVDAIYVATPPDSHLHYALEAAAAGKPCCVEKPIAATLGDAVAMVDAFERTNLPLFVAYYRRSLPRFEKIREWLLENAVGRVRNVAWTLARSPTKADLSGEIGWRTQPASAPGGYFDDLACHGLDLFDHLIGPIACATGFHVNQAGLYGVPDAVAASWIHENGATGTATWNFASPFGRDHVVITGAEGEIEFSIFDECVLSLHKPNDRTCISVGNPVPIQLPHVENMIATLRRGIVHPSTGKSALRTARVMDSILNAKHSML